MKVIVARALIALLLVTGPAAYAQAPGAAPAPAPETRTSANNPSDKAAMSRKCSIEADLRGLHGKARARFRDKCKRGAA